MADAEIDDLLRYERGWANAMGDYWRERMERLRTIDTGRLYAAAGVGPAHEWYKWTEAQGGEKVHRINNGDLNFLGDEYRRDNNLEKPKKVGPAWGGRVAGGEPKGRRDWFSQKYYSSVMKLNEHEATFYGDRYNGLMASALTEIFRGIGAARNL